MGLEVKRVVIVGGGLAGLAAASALARQQLAITLLEARSQLGGRAGAFTDAATGEVLDTCQHVSMGCCTNFAHFCRTFGIAHRFQRQKRLFFLTRDGRMTVWQGWPWPAPWHQLPALVQAHFLSLGEKLRLAAALVALSRCDRDDDPPFAEWLARHRQTPELVRKFWDVVLVSALNEASDRVGLRYARKVFRDAFLTSRQGGVVEVPTVPLTRLWGEAVASGLRRQGVDIRCNCPVQAVEVRHGQATGLRLRGGEQVQADAYLLAVPFDRVCDLLPGEEVRQRPEFAGLSRLETSPIASVHLWYDRPILPPLPRHAQRGEDDGQEPTLPHVVLIGCRSQWVFARGRTAAGEYPLQVVISHSRNLGRQQIEREVVGELEQLFAARRQARLLRCRVLVEKAATFSVRPGVDAWRPSQRTSLPNLFLAGDWTRTGWPATMEGAVRSGYLAAEACMRALGQPQDFLQPDLDGQLRRPA
jgi:squalene-associated FAD-dependent desaturase